MEKFQKIDWRISVLYYAQTYLLIAISIYVSLKIRSPLLYAAAVLFIAARQHTLYLLNHDAGHGTLFESAELNRWAATLFSVCPFFHHMNLYSFLQSRRIHQFHHDLFPAEEDPYRPNERYVEAVRPFHAIPLLKNCAKRIFETIRCTLIGKQYLYADAKNPVRRQKVFHMSLLLRQLADKELEKERRVKILFFLCASSAISYFGIWKEFLLYWIVPMYVALPPILYLMDSVIHNWSAEKGEDNTYTAIPHLWEKIFLGDINITIHWEHHLNPRIPSHRLPEFSSWLRSDPEALVRFQPQPQVFHGILLQR